MGALAEYSAYLDSVPKDDFELSEKVRQGARTESIEELRKAGLTFGEVGDVVIAPRTLKHRKARGERLSVNETERLLRVVRVLAFADRVFGSHEIALRWLRMPDDRLNNTSPLSLLTTEAGGHVVESMLWQIDENIYI